MTTKLSAGRKAMNRTKRPDMRTANLAAHVADCEAQPRHVGAMDISLYWFAREILRLRKPKPAKKTVKKQRLYQVVGRREGSDSNVWRPINGLKPMTYKQANAEANRRFLNYSGWLYKVEAINESKASS
jgi:hypothetical protein